MDKTSHNKHYNQCKNIAWNIILFMYTDKMPTFKFYKNIGINLLIIFIIILSAAYIETYVSINMLT